MNATQVMSTTVITVRPETTILQAARHLVLHKIAALPVVDSQRHLVGIVSEADLFRARAASVGASLGHSATYDESAPVYVKEIMWHDVIWVRPDDSLDLCTQLMIRHNGRSLPVLRGGVPIGIVTRRDVLGALCRIGGGPGGDQALRATAGTGAIDLRSKERVDASR
mgnify:CR=1 FL=1|jgi:CBS domain-containing protein